MSAVDGADDAAHADVKALSRQISWLQSKNSFSWLSAFAWAKTVYLIRRPKSLRWYWGRRYSDSRHSRKSR